jgi:hypothetical protein
LCVAPGACSSRNCTKRGCTRTSGSPEAQIVGDRSGGELRRAEVALVDLPRVDQIDPPHRARRRELEHAPQHLRARHREDQLDRRRRARRVARLERERHGVVGDLDHLRGPDRAAHDAGAQPRTDGGAQHLADVRRAAVAQDRGAAGQLVGLEQEEIHAEIRVP